MAQDVGWPLRPRFPSSRSAGGHTGATAGLSDLEVAWVVRALYREDKVDQPRIALETREPRFASHHARKILALRERYDTAALRLGACPAPVGLAVRRHL